MKAGALPVSPVYFGKLPSRGDFVRSHQQAGLVQTLDRWLSQGIELMAADPRWKEVYDRAGPVHFAFLGVRSRVALAGHLVASRDASGRRFPFIAAGSFEVPDAAAAGEFIGRSPLLLAPLWQRFDAAAREALAAGDPAPVLAQLAQAPLVVDASPQAHDAAWRDFLDLQTLGSFEAMLRLAGHGGDLRRTLLALGLLLQPVPASGSSRLEKGLCLPLPADPQHRPLAAALWLALVSRFLRRGDFELALFLPQGPAHTPPALSIGFSGGSPGVLHAALDPSAGVQVFVDLRDAGWVEPQVQQDYGVRKLSSYLQQPQLSLRQMSETFREAFLGE